MMSVADRKQLPILPTKTYTVSDLFGSEIALESV